MINFALDLVRLSRDESIESGNTGNNHQRNDQEHIVVQKRQLNQIKKE